MEPTPSNLQRVRESLGMSQAEAAELAGLAHRVRWTEYETGARDIESTRWELFLIKCGLHPLYGTRA